MPSTSKFSITIFLFAVRILQDSHPDPLPPGPIHPEPRPNPTCLIPHRGLPQPTSAGVKLWRLWSGDRSLEFWHTRAHTATHAHTRGQAPGSAHALRGADTHTHNETRRTHTHTSVSILSQAASSDVGGSPPLMSGSMRTEQLCRQHIEHPPPLMSKTQKFPDSGGGAPSPGLKKSSGSRSAEQLELPTKKKRGKVCGPSRNHYAVDGLTGI